MNHPLRKEIENLLHEEVKINFRDRGLLETVSGKKYFLKTGPASRSYQCEANGLYELAKPGVIETAEVIAVKDQYILTSYLPNTSQKADFFADFGRSLAKLHQYKGESFGFYEDNFIGTTPQLNRVEGEEGSDWTTFYFNKRLSYQYFLLERNGYATETIRKGFSRLEDCLDKILEGSEESPCLLHGDLWGGNYLCSTEGNAVLIDPAVYYGHREAELAMTRLFGGFAPEFYKAYQETYPLLPGWEYREGIYRLYHVMNHLNLFGRAYLAEAEQLIASYTS